MKKLWQDRKKERHVVLATAKRMLVKHKSIIFQVNMLVLCATSLTKHGLHLFCTISCKLFILQCFRMIVHLSSSSQNRVFNNVCLRRLGDSDSICCIGSSCMTSLKTFFKFLIPIESKSLTVMSDVVNS